MIEKSVKNKSQFPSYISVDIIIYVHRILLIYIYFIFILNIIKGHDNIHTETDSM